MQFEQHEEVVDQVGVIRALAEAGDRIVLIHGERTLRADECLARVRQLARALRAAGLKQGDALGLLSLNRPEAYLAQLAGRLVGARYTPLHPLGSADDHEYVARDAGIDLLVYDPGLYSGRVAELTARDAVRAAYSLGPDPASGEGSGDGPGHDLLALADEQDAGPVEPAPVRGGDVATVYYTGGTTGQPKGVAHTWFGRWYTEVIAVGRDLPATPPRMLVSTPISHAGGTYLGPTILRGGSVVLADKFDPAGFLALIERWRVTETFLVPTMLYRLLDHLRSVADEGGAGPDLSSLGEILYGASPMSPTRLAEAIERFGPIFVQGYGQTEAGVNILRLPPREHRLDRPAILASAGRPTVGVVAKILREDLTEAGTGEVGELCLRGPFVMKGYWNRPDLTEAALRGGWLHTDDLGFTDAEGYITLVDRRKDMIISGGFNVYPSEVENAISELPGVAACAVIGVPDERWGEAVKTFVVPHDGAALTGQQVIDHVRERKGGVNTPKAVDFVAALPLTGTGKLDKKALRGTGRAGAARQTNE